MPSLRPSLSFLLPLIVGGGLLTKLPEIAPLVRIELSSFLFPERFQKDYSFVDRSESKKFQLTCLDFTPDPEANLNIKSYLLDKESLDIMGSDGGSSIEWAQFLAQTRLDDDRLTVITSSLSWDDASELAILALQGQVDETPSLVIGLQAEFINSEAPLPEYLKPSIIPLKIPAGFDLPKIDHIRRPSSINSSSFGISEIRGLKLESDGDQKLVPMLVRWDNQILPTLTLASILKSQRLKSGDLILEKDGYLRLGSESVILKLDQKGRAALPSNEQEQEQKSASTLQIYPEQAETYKIITPSSAPKSTYGLEGQIRQALSQKAVHKLTYKRWSLPFELALLLTLVSLLHIRRIWSEPFILICVIGGSVLAGKWMLLSPLVLIIITFHLCPRGSSPRQKH
ncbi:hypothetical protein OAA12_03350 [Akkermansiaceae bacterium]|nr:hypothetical protein [Akkermansiaceae bacterium]